METMDNNRTQDDVLELIGKFPIEPLFNRVVITLNTNNMEDGIIVKETSLSETQFIVAVGPMAKAHLSPGQKVIIDLEKLMVKTPLDTDVTQKVSAIKIDPIIVDDIMYSFLEDRLIKCKDNR